MSDGESKSLFRKHSKGEKQEFTKDDKKEIVKDAILLVLAMVFFSTIVIWLFAETSPNNNCAYNCILAAPFFGLLLTLTRRFKVTVLIAAAFFSFAYYVNAIVYAYRFAPIVFQDFFNYKEAGRVADRFDLFIDHNMYTHIMGALFLAMLFWALELLVEMAFRLPKRPKKKTTKELYFGLGTMVGTILLVVIMDLTGAFPIKSLGINVNDYTARCGLIFAWYSEYKTSNVEQPEGYNAEELEALLDECQEKADKTNGEMEPDVVIVVMNESLADYSLLGNPRFSEDPLQGIHDKLEEDSKYNRGVFYERALAVSVYGGNTCNSELEYLTGSSMAFYPEGSCPYIRYIKRPTPSYVRDFGLDSQAIAVHPYYGAEWNRKTVYPLMGFDEFVSGENFSKEGYDLLNVDTIQNHHIIRDSFGDDLEYVRGFISDRQCFDRLLEIEANNPQKWKKEEEDGKKNPQIIFTITIQNHGGYTGMDETFVPKEYTVYQEGNEYLTSSSCTDEAFLEFIEHLERRKEKVAVLMFGDHQPSLENINYYITMNQEFRNNEFKKYVVPYFIWTNYKIDKEPPEQMISLNYLSAVFKDTVGIPLTGWDEYRLEAMEEYPVITANFTVDKNGKYESILDSKDSQTLKDYEAMQYYRMFEMVVEEE